MTHMQDGWRIATTDEVERLAALDGAPHVTFGCAGCGLVNWSAKNLALTPQGGYSGSRGIFVLDWSKGECACAPILIRCVVRE